MLDTMKNRRIGSAEVIEKFGVAPDKVMDVQALAGDSVDNVPGVPGIGVKTAAELISQYGDLETLLARAGEIKQPKRRENLMENADIARISRELVTLAERAARRRPMISRCTSPTPGLIAFLDEMEFNSFTRRVGAHFGIDDVEGIVAAIQAKVSSRRRAKTGGAEQRRTEGGDSAHRRAHRSRGLRNGDDGESLEHWVARARETGRVCVDTETTSLDPMQAGCAACRCRWLRERPVTFPAATHGRRARSRWRRKDRPD